MFNLYYNVEVGATPIRQFFGSHRTDNERKGNIISAIENVISYVDITNLGTGNTGGLSGYYGGRDPAVINNCAVYADISGGGNTGGIIGSGWGGTRFYRIYNTVVVGTVSGTTAGALVSSVAGTSGSSGVFAPQATRPTTRTRASSRAISFFI